MTSGAVEPPANPLAVSQPCIRLTDVDAVGRSGRHLTTFEMMAHHVFNRPDEGLEIYWMETCVEHCHRMLTDTFSVPAHEITYVENPWCGGGNAGAAVEVIVGGLSWRRSCSWTWKSTRTGMLLLKGTDTARCRFKSLTPATDWSDFVGPPPARQPSTKPFIQRPWRGSKIFRLRHVAKQWPGP